MKRVKNSKKAKRNVQNDVNQKVVKKLYIDFNEYPNWTHSYSGKKFTNTLKDEKEAAKHFYFLLNELFGSIEKNIKFILANNDRHSHKLTGKERALAVKIVKQIDGIHLDDDANVWQLSSEANKGIRIVGVITTDQIYTFYPLFIDHYHQLFPDEKKNEPDYYKFTFCPQDNWK